MRIFSRRLVLHLCHTEMRMTSKRLLRDRKTTKRLNLVVEASGVKSGMMEARAAAEGEDHTSKLKLIVRIPKKSRGMTSAAAVVRRLIKTTECSNGAPHRNGSEDNEKSKQESINLEVGVHP